MSSGALVNDTISNEETHTRDDKTYTSRSSFAISVKRNGN
jgi:hypothetical protein